MDDRNAMRAFSRQSRALHRYSRRRFLRAWAALLPTPWVIPARAVGLEAKTTPPSERITIGLIGLGAMGRGHLAHMLQFPEVQVLAVCDVDRWRREDAQRITHQTYAAKQPSGAYRGCAAYHDLRELLERQDIDAVIIATGDRWHALATVLAAQAGKDIYCEKPCSLTIQEARVMMDVVRRYGRIFQGGFQQRSSPEFVRACQLVRQGVLGKVRCVYVNFPGTSEEVNLPPEPVPEGLDWELWLGPAPWRPYHHRFHPYGMPRGVVPWHFCRDFGGGNLTSNAVHAFDVVQWALGMDDSGPVEIIPPETGQVPVLTYKYAMGTVLQVVPGRLNPNVQEIPPKWDPQTVIQPFGALYVGDNGWIHVGREGYLVAHPAEILQHAPKTKSEDRPVYNHHLNWLGAIRSRSDPVSNVESACRSTIVSHLGCIAHWTGRGLRWNPVEECFLDDYQANLLRSRPMRQPWRLE
ncbi:MAG: Gfo/Idh/MocA family oxidoreductase [Thermoguttaceae bacterium]|nr:Gfo/Idh/MocA family oxidoreductase [Thermoguttaceae bacterium]MDW8036794.1 Gfo/Idh/MocA family oxidoreductase [Thermoguttaceae bacterium]